MKKKTLLTLLAACLLTMGLSSCFCYDDYGYGYGYRSYYHHRPTPRAYHHGGHHHHHGPNAEMMPETQVILAE